MNMTDTLKGSYFAEVFPKGWDIEKIAACVSQLPVGDMLSAFIGNLALNLGLKIEENISLGVEISVQGNIYFDSEEKTELAVEIKDSIGDTLILGAYLRGKALYVDMGIISEHNFVFEETGIVAMVLQAVKDLLQGEEDATSPSEATTAAGDAEEEALDALEIVMELSSGHIALHVTEAVLMGLLLLRGIVVTLFALCTS